MWRSLGLVVLALTSAQASPDLTVKTVARRDNLRMKSDRALSWQENLYVRGHNQRRELLDSLEPGVPDFSFGVARLVIIERCDEGLLFHINPATREYIRTKTLPPVRTGWREWLRRKKLADMALSPACRLASSEAAATSRAAAVSRPRSRRARHSRGVHPVRRQSRGA